MKIPFLCTFETNGVRMEYGQDHDPSSTLKIYCCRYEENIYPWIQNDLRTPSWRFYWNPVPGGFLRAEEKEIPLLPEYFYILPGYFCFSTLAKTPFSKFYIHFDLNERQVPQYKLFRIPADDQSKELIRRFIRRIYLPDCYHFLLGFKSSGRFSSWVVSRDASLFSRLIPGESSGRIVRKSSGTAYIFDCGVVWLSFLTDR